MFVLGGLYRLNESSISFTNPTAIEPDMNISMVDALERRRHDADLSAARSTGSRPTSRRAIPTPTRR